MVKKTEDLYLRFVLLSACNAKCYFCHREGDSDSTAFVLDPEVVLEAVRAAVPLGIKTFKFTGGEPLAYKGLGKLISQMKEICPEAEISLTTNGILLRKRLTELLAAGLGRANVSLQTLDREKYIQIMGVDMLDEVLEGIVELSAIQPGSKICSAFSLRNADEILKMARWANRLGLGYRVHNLLPVLDIAKPDVIPIEEIEERISRFPGAVRREIERNGKHRLIFTGPDWEILVPNWRFWKPCEIKGCPLNNNAKGLCKEGEIYALRVTPDQMQTCLMGNHKGFPFGQVSEVGVALKSACEEVVG